MPSNREQDKRGCEGQSFAVDVGGLLFYSQELDDLLVRYLKEMWEPVLQISGQRTILAEGTVVFSRQEHTWCVPGTAMGWYVCRKMNEMGNGMRGD